MISPFDPYQYDFDIAGYFAAIFGRDTTIRKKPYNMLKVHLTIHGLVEKGNDYCGS